MKVTSSSKKIDHARGRGRPREFDLDEALDQIIRVLSERGYHGTSISDLVQATNLTQGRLYKAFKDKEAIFLAALERYRTVRANALQEAIGKHGNGIEQLRRALTFYAASSTGEQGQQGCLVAGSLAEISTFPEQVSQHIQTALKRNEVLLSQLIKKGQEDGSIPTHINSETSARMLLCLIQGMRIVGKSGCTHGHMNEVVDTALEALT